MFGDNDNEIPESSYRITSTTRMLMVPTAAFFDVLGLVQLLDFVIPLLGTMLSKIVMLVEYLTFYLWFKMHNVGMMERIFGRAGQKFGAKRIFKFLIPLVGEAVATGLPGFTINVIFTIQSARAIDYSLAKGWITQEELEMLNDFVENNAGAILKGHIRQIEFDEAKKAAGVIAQRHTQEQMTRTHNRVVHNEKVQRISNNMREMSATARQLEKNVKEVNKYVDNIQPRNSEEPVTIS